MLYASYVLDGTTWCGVVGPDGLHPLPAGVTGLDRSARAARGAGGGCRCPPRPGRAAGGRAPAAAAGPAAVRVAFEEHTEDEMVPPPLRPGDVVEMTVEGIGTIRNRVVPGLDLLPVRPAPLPAAGTLTDHRDIRLIRAWGGFQGAARCR